MPSKVQQVRQSTHTVKQREIYIDAGATAAPMKSSVSSKKATAAVTCTQKQKEVAEVSVSEKTVGSKTDVLDQLELESGTKKLVLDNYSKKDLYYK